MQVGKLNPQVPATASASSTSTNGKLNFPGFQEILDFTSAGSESSVSVTVDGDTDKEYRICVRNLDGTNQVNLRLNGDTGANYGYQYINNLTGTFSAGRNVASGIMASSGTLSINDYSLLTPAGFLKTIFLMKPTYSSGTTISYFQVFGWCWNSTANVTTLTFIPDVGNFTSGTRIVVYARRSQS